MGKVKAGAGATGLRMVAGHKMSDTQRFYDMTAEATAEEWYANDVLLPTLQDCVSMLPRQRSPTPSRRRRSA